MENLPFVVSALVFVFALRLFKRVFTCAFAHSCICVARVNQPYELFYSAGVTNSIYILIIVGRCFTSNNA